MRAGEMIRLYRVVNKISLRKAAKDIGIAAATLSRFENGSPLDQANFIKLVDWLFAES